MFFVRFLSNLLSCYSFSSNTIFLVFDLHDPFKRKEEAFHKCSTQKVFWKRSLNSKESIFVGIPFSKRDSGIDFFMWNLRNFSELLFYKIPSRQPLNFSTAETIPQKFSWKLSLNDTTFLTKSLIKNMSVHLYQRRIRNPVKHLRWSFLWK